MKKFLFLFALTVLCFDALAQDPRTRPRTRRLWPSFTPGQFIIADDNLNGEWNNAVLWTGDVMTLNGDTVLTEYQTLQIDSTGATAPRTFTLTISNGNSVSWRDLGGSGGGMNFFDVSADSGPTQTIMEADELHITGNGETIFTSAWNVDSISIDWQADIDDLRDVDAPNPDVGNYLIYNGTHWEAQFPHPDTAQTLSIDSTGATAPRTFTLTISEGNSVSWQDLGGGGGGTNFEWGDGSTTTNIGDGETVQVIDGTNITTTLTGNDIQVDWAANLSDLGDVILSPLTDGQVLTYFSGLWTNTTLPPFPTSIDTLYLDDGGGTPGLIENLDTLVFTGGQGIDVTRTGTTIDHYLDFSELTLGGVVDDAVWFATWNDLTGFEERHPSGNVMEWVIDTLGYSALVAGTNMNLVYDDVTNTITFNATGGGSFTSFDWGDGSLVTTITDGETIRVVDGTNITTSLASNDITIDWAANIDDLTDVNATGPALNQILKWNGSEWALATDETGAGGSMTNWIFAGDSGPDQTVTEAETVTFIGGNGITTTAAAGENLTIDWIASLTDLSDVTINTPVLNNILAYNGSQWVNAQETQVLIYTPANQQLQISPGNTVILDVDDDDADPNNEIQDLDLTNNTLSIENGNSVDLSPYLDNTDNQKVDTFRLVGNFLEISLERDAEAVRTVDLSSLAGTDDQTLIYSGLGDLAIENGNTVDLSDLLDNTDEQYIDTLELNGTILSISLINDKLPAATVDLSSLQDGTGTDDQEILDFSISSNLLTIDLERDATSPHSVSLVPYLDNTDSQTLSFADNTQVLTITGGNAVDMTEGIQDGTFPFIIGGTDISTTYDDGAGTLTIDWTGTSTDDQTLSYGGLGDLSIENGNSVDLSDLLDNTDNQMIDTFQLVGNVLRLAISGDGQPTQEVDLSVFNNSGTDDQTLTYNGLGSLTIEDGNTVDMSDLLDNTDNQTLSWVNGTNTLSISGGNSVVITGFMEDFILTADSGTNQTITDGNFLDIAGGTNISTVVGATDQVTINWSAVLNDLGNVNANPTFVGEIIEWNGSEWVEGVDDVGNSEAILDTVYFKGHGLTRNQMPVPVFIEQGSNEWLTSTNVSPQKMHDAFAVDSIHVDSIVVQTEGFFRTRVPHGYHVSTDYFTTGTEEVYDTLVQEGELNDWIWTVVDPSTVILKATRPYNPNAQVAGTLRWSDGSEVITVLSGDTISVVDGEGIATVLDTTNNQITLNFDFANLGTDASPDSLDMVAVLDVSTGDYNQVEIRNLGNFSGGGGGGASISLTSRFSTSTTPPPSDRGFIFNNATQTSTTQIHIDKTSWTSQVEIGTILLSMRDGDELYLQEESDDGSAFLFELTSDATDNGTYVTYDVSLVDDNGGDIGNNEVCVLILLPHAMESWFFDTDDNSPEEVTDGQTVDIVGGLGMGTTHTGKILTVFPKFEEFSNGGVLTNFEFIFIDPTVNLERRRPLADVQEWVEDFLGTSTLVGGSNISTTYDDGAGTITIDWSANIGDLDNVLATAPSTNDVLTWNGSNWAPAAPSGGGGTMDDFNVAGDSGPAQTIGDGNTLTIIGGTGIATVASATDNITVNWSADLNDLTDVSAGSPSTGDLLEWSGSAWVATDPLTIGQALDSQTSGTVDFNSQYTYNRQIDMNTSSKTMVLNNPVDGGIYVLHFINAAGTDLVTWPGNVLFEDGTSVSTDILSHNDNKRRIVTLMYDGTNYYTYYSE